MYRIVYLSTARSLFSDQDLEDILSTSRRNNQAANVTGILLYHDGGILQVLEGESQKLEQLMQIISADPRHYGIIQVIAGEISTRSFSEWSMGFRRLSAKEWSDIEGYIPVTSITGRSPEKQTTDRELVTLIQSFCRANFS